MVRKVAWGTDRSKGDKPDVLRHFDEGKQTKTRIVWAEYEKKEKKTTIE
jgi:hypothetical protein